MEKDARGTDGEFRFGVSMIACDTSYKVFQGDNYFLLFQHGAFFFVFLHEQSLLHFESWTSDRTLWDIAALQSFSNRMEFFHLFGWIARRIETMGWLELTFCSKAGTLVKQVTVERREAGALQNVCS